MKDDKKKKKTKEADTTKEPEKKKKEVKVSEEEVKKPKKKKETGKFVFENGDAKSIVIDFGRLFGDKDLNHLNKFYLHGKRKKTYVKLKHDFIESNNKIFMYDKNNSLLLRYLTMKNLIDKYKTSYKPEDFIKELYLTVVNKELVDAINQYIADEYKGTETNNNKKRNEALEFTEEIITAIYKVSIGIKYILPLSMQYVYYNHEKIDSLKEFLSEAFSPMFDYFENGPEAVNKFIEIVRSRINATCYSDKVFWDSYVSQGEVPDSFTIEETKKIVVDIIPKFDLNRNLVHLIHVVLKNDLRYLMKENFKLNYKSIINSNEDQEGLSDFDKFEINTVKTDEGKLVQNKLGFSITINKIIEDAGIEIKPEELTYYVNNMKINDFQKNVCFLYFAKFFGGIYSLHFINKSEYTLLCLVLSKILQKSNFIYLDKYICANVKDNEYKEKRFMNKKSIFKITESPKYANLMRNKYGSASAKIEESEVIFKIVNNIKANNFVTVHPDPKKNNLDIRHDSNVIDEEILRLIEMI